MRAFFHCVLWNCVTFLKLFRVGTAHMEWTTSFYDINLRSAFRCLAFKGVSDHRQLCAAGWEAWPATCKPLAFLAEACRWGRTRTAKRAKPCGCWCHMALHVRDLGSNFKVNAYMSPVFRSVSLDNFVLLLFSSHQKYESKQIHAKPSILIMEVFIHTSFWCE